MVSAIFQNQKLRLSKVFQIILIIAGISFGCLAPDDALCFDYVIFDCPGGVCNVPVYPVPDIPKPGKGELINDPDFHTAITRMTDKDIDQYNSRAILNTYSRNDPVNADGTKVILMAGARYYIYDADTFQLLRRLSQYDGGQIPCCQEIEPRWDNEDPNVFYYRDHMRFFKYDYSTDTSTLIHDFQIDFPQGGNLSTRTEGAPSMDRKYWAFTVRGPYPGYEWIAIVIYDLETDAIVGELNSPAPHDTLSISPLGNRVVVDYNWPGQVTSYALNFSDPVEIGTIGHSDLTLNSEGRQVRVFEDPTHDWIAMADLETGEITNLLKLPLTGEWATSSGNHISGSNYSTPGWVLMSTYGTIEKTEGSWPFNLIFMLELKENPRIWLITHTHSPQSDVIGKDYWAEAFAAIDKNGSRVIWGSNWDNPGIATPIDAFQATLPENWWQDLDEQNTDDTIPPVRSDAQPSDTLARNTASTTISLSTNEDATCRYSDGTPDIRFEDMVETFATTNSRSHSSELTGLANGQTYNLYIRCQDAAGNANMDDFLISFSIAGGGELNKVLFIGDNRTANAGGVHNHFQNLLAAAGKTVDVDGIFYSDPFSRLNNNYPGLVNRQAVIDKINNNDWDAVVLQSNGFAETEENFYDAGGSLIDLVKNNSSAPALYMIWGRKSFPDQDALYQQRYEQLGADTNTLVAGIGAGIRAAHNAGLDVFNGEVLLNLKGSYLAGAMYYAFFTGESPVGLDYDGFVGSGYFGSLTPEEALELQEFAWQAVSNYGVFWQESSSDTTAPHRSNAQPGGTLPQGTTSTTVSLSTDENATCRYSISTTRVAYDDMPNTFSTTGGISHSLVLSELSDGQAYNLYVRCQDAAGNTNTNDFPISFNVASGASGGNLNKILFIGNSYTGHSGGVYNHFQKMMEESGRTVEVAGEIHGGEAFSYRNANYPGHANRPEVTARINSTNWDAVVLQSYGLAETVEEFHDAGSILIDRVRANTSTPALFMIWGREAYPEQDALYRQRYEQLGTDTDTPVVPIGIGIRTARNAGIDVYSDGSHLSLQGAYLAGAMFYAFFTGESPVGLQYDGYIGSGYFGRLTSQETEQLQEIAWQAVSDYGVFWD